jgi:recombination protein RecA
MAGRKMSAAKRIAARVNAQLGETVVGVASDPRFTIERVPIGSLTMERITGGGFPRGRHVELFGDFSSAKSYVAYMTMALAQERGEVCALIDAERVFDEAWFRYLGGDPEQLLIFRPKTTEKVIKTLQLFAQNDDDNPGADIVVIDSVASLLPREELEKDVDEGDDRTAGRARSMSRLLRRVTAVNDKTLFLWTNQYIDKVSGYGGVTTPGGRALKFYTSIRVEMRVLEREKKERVVVRKGKRVKAPVVVGRWVGIRADKNKTASPEMESMFYFDYEQKRIDREREIITLGLLDGLIERRGDTFYFTDSEGEEHSGVERTFRRILEENEEVREELEWAISENSASVEEDDADGGDESV